jgi:hypothetical protein
MQQVNPGRLIAYIDRSWDLRRDIQDHIHRLLPAIQDRARQTNEFAIELLRAPVAAH